MLFGTELHRYSNAPSSRPFLALSTTTEAPLLAATLPQQPILLHHQISYRFASSRRLRIVARATNRPFRRSLEQVVVTNMAQQADKDFPCSLYAMTYLAALTSMSHPI